MKANTFLKKIFLLIFLSFGIGNVFSQDSIQNNFTYSNYSAFYYDYEHGVSNMLSIQDVVRLRYNEKILFSFAWRFHLNQQVGLGSFYLAVEEWQTNKKWLAFGVEYEHHEYPAYKIGENQFALISFFKPWEKVRLGAGFTYRAADLEDKKVHSPLKWSNEMKELCFIFQARWDMFELEKWKLVFKLGTYDFMRIQTKDHLFFEIEQKYAWHENSTLHLGVSTALKGISGLVLAVNEFQIETGLSFQF